MIHKQHERMIHNSCRMRSAGRFLLAATAAITLLCVATQKASAQEKKFGAGDIQILPATKLISKPVDPLSKVPTHVEGVSYWDVYQSIPFIRSEYNANPSYRHEATMRILFGQLFPDCCRGAR